MQVTGQVRTDLPTARWASVLQDGSVEWDTSKIKCYLDQEERKDQLLLRNIVHGSIASSKMYPLIFDHSTTKEATTPTESSHYRSLPFLKEMVASRAVYDQLNEDQKLIVAVGLRDLYLASSAKLLTLEEESLFKDAVDLIEDTLASCEAQGLKLSFHPSRRFKVIRFIERSIFDNDAMEDYFAQVGTFEQGLCAVFVDPSELSYHNFENIVPLDPWLEGKMQRKDEAEEIKFEINEFKQIQKGKAVWSFKIESNRPDILEDLQTDLEDLYVPPFNSSTRGGKRMIFHSALLSKFLTNAVKASPQLLAALANPCPDDEDEEDDDKKSEEQEKNEKESEEEKKAEGERKEEVEEEKKEEEEEGLFGEDEEEEDFFGGDLAGAADWESSLLSRYIEEASIIEKEKQKEKQEKEEKEKKEREERERRGVFAFINFVFRLNKFAPGDHKFSSHLDTPYYDAMRSHISKYTLLLYLTAGKGDPYTLRVGSDPGVHLTEFQAMTGVIFDQAEEHEGVPYMEGDKVFLRTELVFEQNELQHNPLAASLFSTACYLTTESVFSQELAAYSHRCYEAANALHWGNNTHNTHNNNNNNNRKEKEESDELWPYLIKTFKPGREGLVTFLTNGYDYWFLKKRKEEEKEKEEGEEDDHHLKLCTVVAALDYFNGKVFDEPFKSLCETRIVTKEERRKECEKEGEGKSKPLGWIWKLLRKEQEKNAETDKEREKGEEKERKEVTIIVMKDDKEEELKRIDPDATTKKAYKVNPDNRCCPTHDWGDVKTWVPEQDESVLATYDRTWKYSLKRLLGAPLLFLGNDRMVINPSNVHISNGDIFFSDGVKRTNRSTRPLFNRINFAACWNSGQYVEDYIGIDAEIGAPRFAGLPPIRFEEEKEEEDGGGYHLIVDFFKNDWMVEKVDLARKVPIPSVLSNDKAQKGVAPFAMKLRPNSRYYWHLLDNPRSDEETEDEEDDPLDLLPD